MMDDTKKEQKIERNTSDWMLGGATGLISSAAAWWGCVELQLRSVGIEGHAGAIQLRNDIKDTIHKDFLENAKGHLWGAENWARRQNAMDGGDILRNLPQLEQPNGLSTLVILGTLVGTTIVVSGWLAKQHEEKKTILPYTTITPSSAEKKEILVTEQPKIFRT